MLINKKFTQQLGINQLFRWTICYVFSAACCLPQVLAQQTINVMSYNILNYSQSSTEESSYLQQVVNSAHPDILVVQEIRSESGLNMFYNEVMSSDYTMGHFIDGYDSDNAIFYNAQQFSFVSNKAIETNLRDINEFTLVHTEIGDTLRIYSVHLAAGSGSSKEIARSAEIDSLRKVTDALPPESNFIVCGDFNIYKSEEEAYQRLTLPNGKTGYVIDPLSEEIEGTWNNSNYAAFHTQSTRSRQFGGGSHGGLDDRFDMILYSQSIANQGGIEYVYGSTRAMGNDGAHYNDSINANYNLLVSNQLANALHYASDHLPVVADFILVDAVGVNEHPPSKFTLQIQPNPATSEVVLQSDIPTGFYQLFDVQGKILKSGTYQNKMTLNTGALSCGVYAISVFTNTKRYWNKFVKQAE